jgi:hypothetical protein
VALLGGIGWLGRHWIERRRLHRAQMAVVAPNAARAAAQPLARRTGVTVLAGIAPPIVTNGTGRLIDTVSDEVYALNGGPAIIGTSRRHATIVMPIDADVAPEHARIWLRDGRYLLHHVGGMSRKTYVNNHEADWVVLESGDEIRLGRVRFTFEE